MYYIDVPSLHLSLDDQAFLSRCGGCHYVAENSLHKHQNNKHQPGYIMSSVSACLCFYIHGSTDDTAVMMIETFVVAGGYSIQDNTNFHSNPNRGSIKMVCSYHYAVSSIF